jgi:hypothetical protein
MPARANPGCHILQSLLIQSEKSPVNRTRKTAFLKKNTFFLALENSLSMDMKFRMLVQREEGA